MRDDYRRGFADQTNEITAPSLEVEGVIPDWLSGTLLRNGPARFRLEDKTLNHWFDGLAMLHKFDIANGQVSYANKFVDSPAFRGAKDGQMQYGEFATDPCRSLFKRIAQIFMGSTPGANANVSIGKIGRWFVAQTETPVPVAFDKKTLETIGTPGSPSAVHASRWLIAIRGKSAMRILTKRGLAFTTLTQRTVTAK